MSQPIRDQGIHLGFLLSLKTQTCKRTFGIASYQMSLNFVPKLQGHQPIRDQGGRIDFPIGLRNTNFLEDVSILFPVNFCRNPSNGWRGRCQQCLYQSEARVAILVFWLAGKHKLDVGCCVLPTNQVSLNSVLRLQRRNKKCLSQSETRTAMLPFPSAWKTQT